MVAKFIFPSRRNKYTLEYMAMWKLHEQEIDE